ncbi:MAG: EVE domain-containing protein [Chthonomonas sp.]|nr:EVE domain-containing protein [Chthonomonas sp.]
MAYWLLKSEPDTYGIDDLARDGTNMWEGCRNWTVRGFLKDQMKPGDLGFFYHSNIAPIGVIGIMEVVSEGYPDPTQFDPKSDYYDPKATPEKPRWTAIDVKFIRKFDRCVTLQEMKDNPSLEGMLVVRKGQRLSIMPVEEHHWKEVLRMAGA